MFVIFNEINNSVIGRSVWAKAKLTFKNKVTFLKKWVFTFANRFFNFLVNVEINDIGLLLKPDSFLLEKILLVLEKFIDGDWTNVIFLDKS